MSKAEIDSWVANYFLQFNTNPTSVVSLYFDDAVFTRDDRKIPGKARIITEYTSVTYNATKVDLHNLKNDFLLSEPQKGEDAGILVNVWGGMTFPGQNERKFNQTFRLVRNPMGRLWVAVTILSVHDP